MGSVVEGDLAHTTSSSREQCMDIHLVLQEDLDQSDVTSGRNKCLLAERVAGRWGGGELIVETHRSLDHERHAVGMQAGGHDADYEIAVLSLLPSIKLRPGAMRPGAQ